MDSGTWLAVSLSTGDECLTLDDTKNYVLSWPSTPKRGFLRVSGGGHVVMVGGHSIPENRWPKDVPACGVSSTNAQPRAVHVQDGPATPPNRVVHVEGLLVEHQAMSDGGRAESDAFGSGPESAEKTILQLQNVRVKNLQGSEMGVHADAVQVHGGFAALRVDRMTIESQYNALYLRNTPRADCTFALVGPVDLRNVNVTGIPVQGLRICSGSCIATCSGGASACACGDGAGNVSCTQANWAAFASTVKGVSFGRRDTGPCPIGEAGESPTDDVSLTNVWLAPYGSMQFGNFVYPDRGHSVFPVDVTTVADAGFWPALQSASPSRGKVTGHVTRGVPPGGDFCASAGCAGLGYKSPGYQPP